MGLDHNTQGVQVCYQSQLHATCQSLYRVLKAQDEELELYLLLGCEILMGYISARKNVLLHVHVCH